MTIAIIALCGVALAISFYIWHRLGDPVQDHEEVKRSLAVLKAQEELRAKRREELQKAYQLAKEELGGEPTIDQIFLTRDQLRTQRKLDGQTRR